MSWEKILLATLVTASFVFVFSGSQASAHPCWSGYSENLYQGLTSEKQKQFDALLKDFDQNTQKVRDQLRAKQIELQPLGINGNVEAIRKAAEDIVELENTLDKAEEDFAEQIAKEIGINIEYASPMYQGGPCNRGYGHHRSDCPYFR